MAAAIGINIRMLASCSRTQPASWSRTVNSKWFVEEPAKSSALVGMTERCDLLGGTQSAGPGPKPCLAGTSNHSRRKWGFLMLRVLIADDQEMVRAGLHMILEAQPDIEVVGEAADGAEAIALATKLRPDVCIMDIRMPGTNGITATRALAEPIEPLTEREEEVLKALARGLTNAEIGEELHVSLSTVKSHINTILTKLNARNRVELAIWAHQSGRMA
jgi:DNA-binding CsgD family transcriptional regulator